MGAVGVRIGVHEVGEEAAQDGCQMLLQKRSLESWLYIKRDRVQTFAKAFKKVSLNTQKKEKTRWGEETWTRWGTMDQKRYFQLSSCFAFSVSSLLSLWTDFCIDPIFKEYSASLPSYVFNCNSENIKKVVLGYCNRSISIYFSPMNGSSSHYCCADMGFFLQSLSRDLLRVLFLVSVLIIKIQVRSVLYIQYFVFALHTNKYTYMKLYI